MIEPATDAEALTFLGSMALFIGVLVGQVLLLGQGGWTAGKRLARMRIVRSDGSPAGLARILWLRMTIPFVLSILTCLVFPIVDALFVFRADRRCLHDLIAGTKVVAA